MAAEPVATATVVDRLVAAGCVAAEEEAAELLTAAPDAGTLEAWLRRREQGEPLAWVTGTMQFCGLTLRVDPGVYVPRIQSEELARRAVSLLTAGGGRAVDLCTGAGAIAATLAARMPAAVVVGLDVDPRSTTCARRNGVRTVRADVDHPPLRRNAFDLVTAVAPYVPTGLIRLLPADVQRHEPRLALDGGDDGLHLVRRVIATASRLLRPGGWLVIELGGDQDRAIGPALDVRGFHSATPWFDDDGDLRGLAAQAASP